MHVQRRNEIGSFANVEPYNLSFFSLSKAFSVPAETFLLSVV